MTEWTASFIEVELRFHLEVTHARKVVLDALVHAPWPRLTEEVSSGKHSAEWKHENVMRGLASKHGDGASIDLHITDTAIEHCWRWLVASEELIHRLLSNDSRLALARVSRHGVGARCIPVLPAIGGATHLFAAPDVVLAEGFEEVESALGAGRWDTRRMGDHQVLARAMHAETNVELMAAIWDGQWAMARLSRPGASTYNFEYEPEPEELPIFKRGERRLQVVGYDEGTRASIYSCALEADLHVQPWEIWTLGQALHRKKLPSGEAIDAVRVIFADEASATRERRPLLDVGVTVQCYGSDGKVKTLPRDR